MRILRGLVLLFGSMATATVLARGADEARPVATWASGLMEVRVAFDRAVGPTVAAGAEGRLIGFGEGEKTGGKGRPGGDRGALRVAAARLVDGGRTMVLTTDPHPREATYSLTIPGVSGAISYNLGGVEVAWSGVEAKWSGWWPSVDPGSSRKALDGSSEHDRLWPLLERSGKLSGRTLVAMPAGAGVLAIEASGPFEATLGQESAKSAVDRAGHHAVLKAESTGEAIELVVSAETGPGFWLKLNSAGREVARSAMVLPWAPASLPTSPEAEVPADLLIGGDPSRGRAVFLGEQAKCSACHKVGGEGAMIGPDLTNLSGRDRAWIYRNILEPSASIHPEYASFTVAMKDGRVAMGVVRAEGADSIRVVDIESKATVLPRAEVEEIRPSASSIMPVGLLGAIGDDRTRDLLAFLTAANRPSTSSSK